MIQKKKANLLFMDSVIQALLEGFFLLKQKFLRKLEDWIFKNIRKKTNKSFNHSKEDVNVFVVDWKEGAASPNYLAAFSNVKVTGPKIADFIQQAGIDPGKVHCIGHSLGKLIQSCRISIFN